jgi:hypothetical protein
MATPHRTERIQVEIEWEMLKAIEDFRLRERIPTKSDAARKLLLRAAEHAAVESDVDSK